MSDSPPDFTWLPDLALRTLGGAVVWANDDSFAEKENLIKPGPAGFQAARFGHRGQIYDGWETRRRREPGHDDAVVRLGVPGVIRGVVVDTAWFKGNYPPEVSVDAIELDEHLPAEQLAAHPGWRTIVARSKVYGDSRNPFEVDSRGPLDARPAADVPRRRGGPPAGARRGAPRSPVPAAGAARPRCAGERRPGGGLLEPVLHLAAEPDLPRHREGDGRRLGNRAAPRRRQRLGADPARRCGRGENGRGRYLVLPRQQPGCGRRSPESVRTERKWSYCRTPTCCPTPGTGSSSTPGPRCRRSGWTSTPTAAWPGCGSGAS